ncbi:unnamed protein product [Penicillium manginii]
MIAKTQAIVAREPTEPLKPNWAMEEVTLGGFGDDEMLVDMIATGICHTDIVLSSVPAGAIGIAYPKIVGHEGAGIVREIGKNVKTVQPGDPILLSFYSCRTCEQCRTEHPAYCDQFAKGNYIGRQDTMETASDSQPVWSQFFGQSSFAQTTVASEASVVNVKNLIKNLDELKLLAPLGCGFQTGMGAIQNIGLATPNDVVLITGLGAVGMGAIMTAKILKCKSIIAVDRVKSRLEIAKSLGATHIIDTSDSAFTTLYEAVRRLIPLGASVAIETTGVPTIIEQSVQATTPRGRFIQIGVPPLQYELSVNLTQHINVS